VAFLKLFTYFSIGPPINGIILAKSKMAKSFANTHENKRQDLSHKPVITSHIQSVQSTPTWLSPIDSQSPPTKPIECFRGFVKNQCAQGRQEMQTSAVTLPAAVIKAKDRQTKR